MPISVVRISVIIPTYNRAEFLVEAIRSVLNQTFKDYEIIIVDDGSTDNTKAVLQKFSNKIRYFYQENKGVSTARNRGIKEASGEYIAFLDSDDIWKINKLSKQIELIESNTKIGLVCCLMDAVDSKGKLLNQIKPKVYPGRNFEEAILRGATYPSTFFIRRECFEEVGLFNENIVIFEDLDLYLRIVLKFKILIDNEPLVYYRIHSSSLTKNDLKVYQSQIVFARKWLKYCHQNNLKIFLFEKIRKYSFLLIKINLNRFYFVHSLRFFSIYIWASFFKKSSTVKVEYKKGH